MEDDQPEEFIVQANFHKEVYSDETAFFSLWTLKGRALCFSTKKSAAMVVM